MTFFSICSDDTCLFRPQLRHNPYKYSTSVGVKPTNAACAPSTETSDVVNYYATEASPKKDAQVAYITQDTANNLCYCTIHDFASPANIETL